MASVITIAGEQLFAAKAQANEQLDIDTFIFANVPNQDPNAPINREEGIPTAHIVYQQNVQQVGRINDNVVVYSTVLDSITGPFEFNWVGLYSSVNQKLVAINHVPTVSKTKTVEGAAGNTLNRNFGIEYSGIAELTGITVEPETWQLDFTARLSGMDLLTQQLAADMNGKDWFIDDGLKVVPRATVNTFSVTPGVGYVSGLRVELKQEHILIVQSYPQFVYVDAWFSGNANSTWSPQLAFTVTNTEMDDYIDPSGTQHYVYKLAVINAADDVEDLRTKDSLSEKIKLSRKLAKFNDVISGKFKDGDKLTLVDRDNSDFDVIKNTEELTIDDVFVLDAKNENIAVMIFDRGRISAVSTGGNQLATARAINIAINKLHAPNGDATGGVVKVYPNEAILEETVEVNSPVQDGVESLLVKGCGRQTSFLKAQGVSGDAFKFVYPIYVNLEDFGVRNASMNGINFFSDGGHAGSRNTLNRMHSGFNGRNGYNFERSFMSSIYDSDTRSNQNNGFFWNAEVHTSWNISTCYSYKNIEAGYRAEYLIYSKMQACGSDENQHGYVLQGCKAFHIDACGAESNRRAGWWIQTEAANATSNYISMSATLAFNNDSESSGWANHTHVKTDNIKPSAVFSREAVSLKNKAGNLNPYDFIADGRNAVLVLINPLMENNGPLAKNGGYIHVIYEAPKIVNNLSVSAGVGKKLINVGSSLGVNSDYNGELLITVQNAAFGSTGALGSATYKILISKSLSGNQVVEIAKAGLITGANATHPSFTFSLSQDELIVTPISLTAGSFWFAIEKVAGNIIWK